MVRLILVRHGQTESNVRGLLDAALPGPPLNDLGREQAAALPARLAGERIERIVVSPLARTVETAQPLLVATGLTATSDLRLREVQAGDLEGFHDHESVMVYLETVFAWAEGDLSARVPGSPEDGHDFFRRVDAAVADAVDGLGDDAAVVCVSHGATVRTWSSVRGANVPDDHGRDHGLPNTGIVVLQGAPGAWRVVEWQGDRFGDVEDDPTGAAVPE